MSEPLILPRRTLLVLCGPAGCGKSTFAAQRFLPTEIVGSDHCRALVCDDENDQTVSREAFDVFHTILEKRMRLGRFCVADSTALSSQARARLRQQSRHLGYYGCLLIFNTPTEICLQRDRQRTRQVGEAGIQYQAGLLKQALVDAPTEGWELVHIWEEQGEEPDIVVQA
jgi:protein phosphatase